MSLMAKKKPDRHLQPAMTLRLPPSIGELLRQIAEKEDRTITAVVIRSLRSYAREAGYSWPGVPPASD